MRSGEAIRIVLNASIAVQCASLMVPSHVDLFTGRQKVSLKSFVTAFALTERQMQFWEDVDEGLDDIENFYIKNGQSIDRIRQFSKRFVHNQRHESFISGIEH